MAKAVALALATAAACVGGVTGPVAPERQTIEHGGIRYTSELVERGPEILIARAIVVNRLDAPRALRFPDRCVALFRLYFPDGRLAWDQLAGNKTCREPAVEVELVPGERRAFERFAYAPAVLAHFGLPEGRYEVTLYLRPVGSPVVELALGRLELSRPPPFESP